MKVRIATVEDVQALHQLHFELNCHRHTLQPTNFQGRSVDEEWIYENIVSSDKDYLVLEIKDEVVGMALLEKKEGHTVNGSVRYRYLYLRDFMIDSCPIVYKLRDMNYLRGSVVMVKRIFFHIFN